MWQSKLSIIILTFILNNIIHQNVKKLWGVGSIPVLACMSDNVGIVGDSSCSVTIILLPVVNGVEVSFVGMTVLSAFYDLSTMIIIHTYYSIIILSTL